MVQNDIDAGRFSDPPEHGSYDLSTADRPGDREIARATHKEVSQKLRDVMRRHFAGEPVFRRMADRILAREAEAERERMRQILGN